VLNICINHVILKECIYHLYGCLYLCSCILFTFVYEYRFAFIFIYSTFMWYMLKCIYIYPGTRPGYIDDIQVESVTFGSSPPLLFNVQWSPPVGKENKDDKNKSSATPEDESRCDINSNISNVEKDIKGAKIHENYFGPEKDLENDNPPPIQIGNNDNPKISPGIDINDNSTSDSNNTNNCSSDYHNEDGDDGSRGSDEDVECTADMAFRSGLTFKISTRLWCNWPRDRYASLPVTIILELVEISGRVRFGVDHGSSFVSFLEDPMTRFAVHTEVGGDSFKLKDIPKLSDFIVKKLKDFILKKLVHPKAHRFRLIWPRNWWPEDTQGGFTSTSAGSSKTSKKPDENKSEINIKASKNENEIIGNFNTPEIPKTKPIKVALLQKTKSASSFIEGKEKEKLNVDRNNDDSGLNDNLLPVPIKKVTPLKPANGISVLGRVCIHISI
jgi:hypothetical protein